MAIIKQYQNQYLLLLNT